MSATQSQGVSSNDTPSNTSSKDQEWDAILAGVEALPPEPSQGASSAPPSDVAIIPTEEPDKYQVRFGGEIIGTLFESVQPAMGFRTRWYAVPDNGVPPDESRSHRDLAEAIHALLVPEYAWE